MRNYRDLDVWDKAHKLTLDLYRKSRGFPKEEFYGLTSQLRRAAMSVGANLAEGCGRQTTADLLVLCESPWDLRVNWTITCCSPTILDFCNPTITESSLKS